MTKILLTGAVAASLAALAACRGDTAPPPAPRLPGVTAFPTAQEPSDAGRTLRFAAVGDTGTGKADAIRVAAGVERRCIEAGCDFIALLGDNVYPEGVLHLDDPQWETKVRIPYLSLGYPVRPVLGNHDYGDDIPDPIRADVQVAYSAVQPLWDLPERFHALEDGPALLLFLDTAVVDYDSGYGAEQASFFDARLASSSAPWRIAFGHGPLYSNGREHGNATGRREEFLRTVSCGRVDAYFAGHDHILEVLAPPADCPVTQVVSGAGAIVGEAGDEVPALFTSAELGFAYVVVTPDAMTIEMLDADGEILFTTTLTGPGVRRAVPPAPGRAP